MTAELMYQKFLLKINKNNTQFNIACDKSRFVLIVNEAKNRWVEKHLKEKDSILIDSLQEIIKSDKLISGTENDDFIEYTLESDFYEAILAKSECEKDSCKGIVYSREVKNQDKNLLQFDSSQRPDFDYEWSFYSIQGNTLRVYKTDFKILSTYFEYYSIIPDVQMIGTVNIDGTVVTTDVGINLADQYVDQIINVAAEEFMRDFDNPQGLQIAKDRTLNQE